MTTYENGMLAAAWFTAVGTCGAVVYAIFAAAIKRWCNRSKLEFSVSDQYPNCNLMTMDNPQAESQRFDYIEGCGHVRNVKPYCAKGCQVMCDEIYVPDADGKNFCRLVQLRPRQFPWAEADESLRAIDIPQSLTRYIKLFEIKDVRVTPQTQNEVVHSYQQYTQIVICLLMNKEYIRIPAEYRSVILPIYITSSGVEPIRTYVRIDWKGSSVKEINQPGKLRVKKIKASEFTELTAKGRG